MNGSSVRICSEGLAPLDLDDWDAGWVATGVDVGSQQVRANVSDRPAANGTIDRTALVGARAVTIALVLSEAPSTHRQLLDRLAPFVVPGRRSQIELSNDFEPRYLDVRSDGDVSVPWRAGALRLTLGWVTVGAPFWTGAQRSLVLTPSVLTGPGLIPPLTPPLLLPPGDPAQSKVVRNEGSVDAEWRAEILGPVTDIAIVNVTTGEQVALTGLALGAGQVMVVDSATRTVTVDGESRFAAVDTAISTWWGLPPGDSLLAIPTSTASSPSQVWFRWSDTFYL